MTPLAFQIAAKVTASGSDAYTGGATVTGLYVVTTTSAGSVQLRLGDGSGEILFDVDTPAVADGLFVPVPGRGIRFTDDVHVVFSNVTSVTVFREASA